MSTLWAVIGMALFAAYLYLIYSRSGEPAGRKVQPQRAPERNLQAPDQSSTQWHPEDHGAPGDHMRGGHHRSATAPEDHSTATDPFAHAPVPGPNHVPPSGGQELPPNTQP